LSDTGRFALLELVGQLYLGRRLWNALRSDDRWSDM